MIAPGLPGGEPYDRTKVTLRGLAALAEDPDLLTAVMVQADAAIARIISESTVRATSLPVRPIQTGILWTSSR